MRYKNWSIYWLYDRKSDSVVISENVDFNKNLLTNENTENNKIINQNSIFFSEFFIKFFNKDNKKILSHSDFVSDQNQNKTENSDSDDQFKFKMSERK